MSYFYPYFLFHTSIRGMIEDFRTVSLCGKRIISIKIFIILFFYSFVLDGSNWTFIALLADPLISIIDRQLEIEFESLASDEQQRGFPFSVWSIIFFCSCNARTSQSTFRVRENYDSQVIRHRQGCWRTILAVASARRYLLYRLTTNDTTIAG